MSSDPLLRSLTHGLPAEPMEEVAASSSSLTSMTPLPRVDFSVPEQKMQIHPRDMLWASCPPHGDGTRLCLCWRFQVQGIGDCPGLLPTLFLTFCSQLPVACEKNIVVGVRWHGELRAGVCPASPTQDHGMSLLDPAPGLAASPSPAGDVQGRVLLFPSDAPG